MRCHICNAIDAEFVDTRDGVYLCQSCKSDLDELKAEDFKDAHPNRAFVEGEIEGNVDDLESMMRRLSDA